MGSSSKKRVPTLTYVEGSYGDWMGVLNVALQKFMHQVATTSSIVSGHSYSLVEEY
jgi:hypothetical protein